MTDHTAAARMRRMRERKHAAGLASVTVDVPKPCVNEIKRIAKQMCDEAGTAIPNEETP